MNLNKGINILSQTGERSYKNINTFVKDETNTKFIVLVIVLLLVVFVVLAIILSPFEDSKSLDFNYLIEQEFLSKSMINKLTYNSSPSFVKLNMLERFKNSNPAIVKKVKELVAFNTAKKSSADAIRMNSNILADKKTQQDSMSMATIMNVLSTPFYINVESRPGVFSNIKINPLINPGYDGRSIAIRLQESAIRAVGENPEFSRLDGQSKMKIIDILKEKIISDITSKYKRASAEFALDIISNKLNFQ